MSLAAIISLIAGFVLLLVGGVAGRASGKAAGRKEGAEAAKVEQTSIQNEAAAQSAMERTRVETEINAGTDDDLDARLQKHDRPG
ncbi:hypothetical protein [Pseudomonas sp. B15(2017)]|uniref:hypothetical protein n=1 Tax=Pseudomonas sp. B15(2017) TaxID=1981744 RepID=UPI001C455750|nr:hypothetical protein [Pseudomonas sp. B15(2017)]